VHRLRRGAILRCDAGSAHVCLPGVSTVDVPLLPGDTAFLTRLATEGLVRPSSPSYLRLSSILTSHGLLEYVFVLDGEEHAYITELTPSFELDDAAVTPEAVVLSRFACVRRHGGAVFIDSPEARCRVELVSRHAWDWLGQILHPASTPMLERTGHDRAAPFIELLGLCGMLERANDSELPARASWEFQDLLFHWRTRGGRVSGPQAATTRFLDQLPPPPARKPPMSSEFLDLPSPARASRRSMGEVSEARRSIREQGRPAITLAQLSSLLHRTARVRRTFEGDHQELVLKSVPAAGAIHEIELYAVVEKCADLERGIYHYDSFRHALVRLSASEPVATRLMTDAAEAWAQPNELPQVLLILASRLPRLAWKYEGIAYRLSLLNAGALIHALYLHATDLGLACCALGGGDSDLFARATGLDPLEETSIAEFALGSRRRLPTDVSRSAGEGGPE
jgi:oxazoline/thiazoline dehydrogenase